MNCPECKAEVEELEIIEVNDMFTTIKCKKCGKIVDMFTNLIQQKPKKLPKGVSFVKDVTKKD